jgi:ABC-type phosphate transport system substrate-binding protein
MRTIALRVACLGLIVVGSGLIEDSAKATGSQDQSCSNATLNGVYVFSAVGSSVTTAADGNTTVTPLAVAGLERYHGDGTFSGVVTVSEGGTIVPKASYSGTYTVNRDCSGAETIPAQGGNPAQTFNVFVKPSGDAFRFIETDTGIVLSGDESRGGGGLSSYE